MTHDFDACPLRAFSLFIVDTKMQRIILATKEICTMLGFLPSQLIGHHLAILNLQRINEHRYVFRHDSSHSLVAFDICIHRETTLGLEYWCLHTASPSLLSNQRQQQHLACHSSYLNVLRLDPYGCIEYASASTANDFSRRVVGKSLKNLIHLEDRQRLVDGLNVQQTSYQVLYLRWLVQEDEIDYGGGREGDNHHHYHHNYHRHSITSKLKKGSDVYQWISLTMMAVPRRRSYSAQQDDVTRLLFIVRPATNPQLETISTTIASTASNSASIAPSSPMLFIPLRCLQIMRILFGFCLGMVLETWLAVCETTYQGQRYLIEFLGHLLISILDFLADCIDPAPPSTSSVRVLLGQDELLQTKHHQVDTAVETRQRNEDGNIHTTTEVPWFRPLHRKRWATAVRTLRKQVQSNTVARTSLGMLESIGVVQSSNMFDYLEKVTSEHYYQSLHSQSPPSTPAIKNKQI